MDKKLVIVLCVIVGLVGCCLIGVVSQALKSVEEPVIARATIEAVATEQVLPTLRPATFVPVVNDNNGCTRVRFAEVTSELANADGDGWLDIMGSELGQSSSALDISDIEDAAVHLNSARFSAQRAIKYIDTADYPPCMNSLMSVSKQAAQACVKSVDSVEAGDIQTAVVYMNQVTSYLNEGIAEMEALDTILE